MPARNYPYLIIGGTTKGATTSLFFYLKEHPEVQPSNIKETRFFLDPNYPLPSKFRYVRHGLDKYELLYVQEKHQGRLRVEATPDYLYCPQAAVDIRAALPHAKMLFVLRDPIQRLASWYRFARQDGKVGSGISFEEYVEQQLENYYRSQVPQYMRVLEQGRYARHLHPYYELFGDENIFVGFFEELVQDPASFLEAICRFAGLEPSYYQNYRFQVHHQTRSMRSSGLHGTYKRFQFRLRHLTHDKPTLHRLMRWVKKHAIEPAYLCLNTNAKSQAVECPQHLRKRLYAYYRSDTVALEELIGQPVPWASKYMPTAYADKT